MTGLEKAIQESTKSFDNGAQQKQKELKDAFFGPNPVESQSASQFENIDFKAISQRKLSDKEQKFRDYAEELKNPATWMDYPKQKENKAAKIMEDISDIQKAEGYRTKDQRIEERRRTGIEDSGYDKGYLSYEPFYDPTKTSGVGFRQVPEQRILSRNIDPKTGMIANRAADGASIGLESEVRQKELDIYNQVAPDYFAKKVRDERLQRALNEPEGNYGKVGEIDPLYTEKDKEAARQRMRNNNLYVTEKDEIYNVNPNVTDEDMRIGKKRAQENKVSLLDQKKLSEIQKFNRENAPETPAPFMSWSQQGTGKITAAPGSVTPPSFMNENAALPVSADSLQGPYMFRSQQKYLDPSQSLMPLIPGENLLDSPVMGMGNLGANIYPKDTSRNRYIDITKGLLDSTFSVGGGIGSGGVFAPPPLLHKNGIRPGWDPMGPLIFLIDI